jgi:hypothetical protein
VSPGRVSSEPSRDAGPKFYSGFVVGAWPKSPKQCPDRGGMIDFVLCGFFEHRDEGRVGGETSVQAGR